MHYANQLATLPARRFYTLGELAIPSLARSRRVDVYLPLGYERHLGDRYPVMYMWDGQNLFDPRRSFAGAWHVGTALDLLIAAGEIPPLIVVGIDHGGEHRLSEQSPWPDERFGARGEGYKFLEWVTGSVKPLVDHTFRTRPEFEHTGVAGSSMGGLTTLWAIHEAPAVFGRAAAFSPSLHFAKGAVYDYLKQATRPHGTRLYLDVGAHEMGKSAISRPVADSVRNLDVLLRSRGWQPGERYRWVLDPRGTHSESCWAGRFPAAMRFLWGDLGG